MGGHTNTAQSTVVSVYFFFLQPTRDDRGWLINPIGPNPWWSVLAAIIPALLCTILIFMDQQITAVIVNRKEHKLKVTEQQDNLPSFSFCVCDVRSKITVEQHNNPDEVEL